MSALRRLFRKAKNEWKQYSEVQVLIREATSNDPWGPSSTLMSRIVFESESPANYSMMFTALWKRLTDYEHIKHVLKSLILIEYLLKNCHLRFVADVRLRSDVIRRLKHYKYFKDGRDVGQDVRAKAQAVMKLLEDKELLSKERELAATTGARIKGFSHEFSGFYGREGVAFDDDGDRDPFALEAPQERLQIEYKQDIDESQKDNQDDASSRKKKGKGKKKRVQRKRSPTPEPEVEENEEEENEEREEVAETNNDERDYFAEHTEEHHEREEDKEDDFFVELGRSLPARLSAEPDFITGGCNQSASVGVFSWLALPPPEQQQPQNHEPALFDFMTISSTASASAVKPSHQPVANSSDSMLLFDFNTTSTSTSSSSSEEKVVDPWDLAKEISVLDNLRETSDDRRIKHTLQCRRDRERLAPRLRDLVHPPPQ
jgi:epsin